VHTLAQVHNAQEIMSVSESLALIQNVVKAALLRILPYNKSFFVFLFYYYYYIQFFYVYNVSNKILLYTKDVILSVLKTTKTL